MSYRIVSLCFSCAAFLIVSPTAGAASATTTGTSTLKMVLMIPKSREGAARPILDTVRTELLDMPISLLVETVAEMPDGLEDQISLGSQILDKREAGLVFWPNGSDPERVVFLYRTDTGVQQLTRELLGSGKEGIWDAVGLIVSGTVRYIVHQDGVRVARTGNTAEPKRTAGPRTTPRTPPKTDNTSTEPSTHRVLRFSAELSYVAQLATRAPDLTHGGRLSLTMTTEWFVQFIMGFELFTAVVSEQDTVRFERFRFPLHLGVGVAVPVRRWQLGATLAAVFSVSRHTASSRNTAIVLDAPQRRFLATVEMLARTAIRLYDRLALFAAAGAEIFPQKVVYRVTDGPTLFEAYLRVQPKLLLGAVLWFK